MWFRRNDTWKDQASVDASSSFPEGTGGKDESSKRREVIPARAWTRANRNALLRGVRPTRLQYSRRLSLVNAIVCLGGRARYAIHALDTACGRMSRMRKITGISRLTAALKERKRSKEREIRARRLLNHVSRKDLVEDLTSRRQKYIFDNPMLIHFYNL